MRPHVYYRDGWWRMDWGTRTIAAPTIGALSALARHPWPQGWYR